MLAAITLLAFTGGGLLLLRHSSLSAVDHVQIDGLAKVHGADSGAIEAALRSAAHKMSTLDVKPGALQAAVASYPIVKSVSTHAKFPHGLRIEVLERPPVAMLTLGGARTAVAADGVALGPSYLSSSLPAVHAAKSETTTARLPAAGHRVQGGGLLEMLSVLGAAPPALARAVTSVYTGSKGLTIALRGGLLAYFGDGTRPHAKWISLTRVLADPSSVGAAYVDVRLPERPAAGFAPGTARPGSSAETAPSSGSDPSTAAELAAGLDAAVSGSSSASAATTPTPSAGSESSSTESESSAGSEPGSSTESTSTAPSTEASAASSGEAGTAGPAETEASG